MKKLVSIILLITLCISLVACGEGTEENAEVQAEETETVEEKVESAVESKVYQYNIDGRTASVRQILTEKLSNTKYEVIGIANAQNSYGIWYYSKFKARVKYDPDSDSCDVYYFNMGSASTTIPSLY